MFLNLSNEWYFSGSKKPPYIFHFDNEKKGFEAMQVLLAGDYK